MAIRSALHSIRFSSDERDVVAEAIVRTAADARLAFQARLRGH